MKTSTQVADIVLNLLKANATAWTDEQILYVERVGDSGVKIGVNDGGDSLEYYVTCAGASMAEAKRRWCDIEEDYTQKLGGNHHHLRLICSKCGNVRTCRCKESKTTEVGVCELCDPTGSIDETQSQGLGERVSRRTRVATPEPPIKMMDKTPKRPADNSPLKTSRGRASVRRRVEKNKSHPKQFKESSSFIDAVIDTDASRDAIADAALDIDDPIAESKLIEGIISDNPESKHINKLRHINEVIHNVWENRLYQCHIGVANTKDGEMVVFGNAADAMAEAKKWGYKLCWIERIKRDGFVIYKVCGDAAPSKIFMEHKNRSDRDVILSADRANIIQIIFGDTK